MHFILAALQAPLLAAAVGLLVGRFVNFIAWWLPRRLLAAAQESARGVLEAHCAGGRTEVLAREQTCCAPALTRSQRMCALARFLGSVGSEASHASMSRGLGSVAAGRRSVLAMACDAACACLAALSVVLGTSAAQMALVACASWLLVALARVDAETQLMPDELTAPLLWGALVASALGIGPLSAAAAILGASVGYTTAWALASGARALTGREALGEGDWMLLAGLGALLGAAAVPWVWVFACAAAILGTVLTRATARAFAFGPYLCMAGLVMLFARPWLAPALAQATGAGY